MSSNRPDGEYEALRSEILLLEERAHEVWKWGIVSMLAILGVLVSTLTGLDSGSRAAARIIGVIEHQTVLVASAFLILGAGLTVITVRLATDIRTGIGRVGAYLAVFHEGAGPPGQDMTRLGWHVWNRIEKAAGGRPSMRLPPTRYFRFHGASRTFTALFLFYCTMVVVLFTALTPAAAMNLTGLGLGISLGVAVAVEYLERRSGQRGTAWNMRWAQLARASSEQIEDWLVAARLAEPRKVRMSELLGRDAATFDVSEDPLPAGTE